MRKDSVFKSLADPTRLRLLNLMRDSEVCVCFLVETLREPQPKISRHLAYLKRAGIVETRREGKWMHYRMAKPADEHLAKILNDIRSWLEADATMEKDRIRLLKICTSAKMPSQLKNAPRPNVDKMTCS